MTSFKTLAILILSFAFLQATLASSNCVFRLFKNSPNDANEENNLYVWRGQEMPPYYSAPFNGVDGETNEFELEERTISSFRTLVVGDFGCGYCTVVAYSGKNLSGKSVELNSDGQIDFDFCVKSFTLKCDSDWYNQPMPEEEEEEEEEEEQQEEF